MNQPPDAKVYSGFIDCVIKITAKEGRFGWFVCFFVCLFVCLFFYCFRCHFTTVLYYHYSFSMQKSGPGGLYAGFIPIWARFAPTTCLQVSKYIRQ